jgi:amino acid transporter
MPDAALRRELGFRDLFFFNLAAVIGIRWLAAAAHAGPGSIGLWLVAAAMFFVPSAIVVDRLSRLRPDEGGLYIWTREAFGDWNGFLCGYCYWLNNLFYFPSLTIAGVAMAASLSGPASAPLSEDRTFVTLASIAAIAAITAANIFGLAVSKWIANVGGTATYAACAILLATGAAVWLTRGSQTQMDIMPTLDWSKVNFWPQIAFAFGGLELGAVLGGEIRDPSRTIRRAAWAAGFAIAAFYVLGTAAMLVIVSSGQVNEVTGLTQAGLEASRLLGTPAPGVLLGLFVTLGILGQLGAWIGGSARLPLVLGIDRYLPERFGRLHPRWASPAWALSAQAVFCTVALVAMMVGESLRSGYQLLVDLAVVTYFIPFVYLFLAGWRAGIRLGAASGLLVTLAAIGLSFVPPPEAASVWLFEAKIAGGTLLMIGLARLWYSAR